MYVIVEAHYAVYMYVHKRRLPSNRKLLAGIVFLVADFDKECESFFFIFKSGVHKCTGHTPHAAT